MERVSQRKISTLIVVNAVPRISLPQDKTTLLQLGDDAPPSAPPGVNAKAFARGEKLFKNLWEHIASKWKHFTSQPRSRQPEVLQHTALTYLQDHTNVYDRACMRVYLTASKTETGIGGQLRELVITLPEKQFHGTVNTVQAAPDKALRQTPAGTTEPQMKKTTAASVMAHAAANVTRRRGRRGSLTKQPGYQVPIRRRKVGISLLVDSPIREDLHEIAKAQDVSTQELLERLAVAFVKEHKNNPSLKIDLPKSLREDPETAKKAVRQLAYALNASIK